MRQAYLDPSAWVKRYYQEAGTELTNTLFAELLTPRPSRLFCPRAGYVCGALLMPKHRVDLLTDAFGKERSVRVPLKLDGIDAQALTKRLTDLFDVSRDAARVRLLKLGHLAS